MNEAGSPHGFIPGYTRGYAVGVKTAVSIPDPLFQAADRLARRRRISRSALYAEALELLLAANDTDVEITARLDEVYAERRTATSILRSLPPRPTPSGSSGDRPG